MNKLLNKTIVLSLILSPMLLAETIELEPAQIEASVNSVKINDVSGEELKSADLAESLSATVPSISLVRRSGIANDIILRGQKKDNINVIADGTKTYGACPNRMDPATSHILTNNIESVEVTEGPFDVENFGTLSGLVDIKTKKPSEEVSGEVNVNAGSFNQRKVSGTVSGGTDKVRVLLSASKETSDQYKDGNGDTFADQIDNYVAGTPIAGMAYKPEYRDMKAYDKKTFMGKLYFNPLDNQELRLSYTANRSDDVLYGSSSMDALYDDSDIYNLEYSITDMGSLSKKLDFQAYHSEVEHPMSTKYRISSGGASANEMVSALTTDMDGLKLKNMMELGDADWTIGLDASRRNWDGSYTGYGTNIGKTGIKSIDDVDTDNGAVFTKIEQSFGKVDLEVAARYDDTSIDHGGALQDNDYASLNGYITTAYNADRGIQYFVGAGKSTRVPDARELYFTNSNNVVVGTPTLEQTKNYEVDFGVKKQYENAYAKVKVFHSWLKDFIAYNSSKAPTMGTLAGTETDTFENVDAKVYGIEFSTFYAASDALSFDAGLAYQRGKKDAPLSGLTQNDRDLAEIPPLKVNAAVNYDTAMTSSKIEVVAADKWSNIDEDNGEQTISGYAIANIKWNRDLTSGFDITLGMDNVFDHAYAVSNTYQDLTLLASPGDDVILMNEPGRYIYANLRYRF